MDAIKNALDMKLFEVNGWRLTVGMVVLVAVVCFMFVKK